MKFDDLSLLSHANSIRGVEIFRVGTHNGDVYTEKDLDDMVESFKKLDFRPALKVGHTKDTPGAPAYGWVTNLKHAGGRLLADFESMHDSVVEAMRNKSYDRVSSEIYFNLKRGGKEFRRALKAVALLGAEVPAVANLTPLHKMEFAAEGFEKLGAFEQVLDVPTQAVVDALAQRVGGLVNFTKEYDMKNAAKIKELQTQVDEFKQKLADMEKKGKKDEPEYKQLSEQGAKIEADLKALQIEDSDEEKKVLATTVKAQADKIATLEEQNRKRDIAERVAKVKAPAFRSAIQALYSLALTSASAEKIKVYSVDKDNKPITEEKSVVEIVDGIVGEINHQVERLFKAHAQTGTERMAEDAASENPGAEVDRLAKEYLSKHPELKNDYAEAMTKVLAANPELAKQYSESQGTRN